MSDLLTRLQAALGDRYDVERELGRGGMATVYLANDARHARRVAIKVLNPELAAQIGGERFTREIQIAGQISHPHILALYESGEADGLLYYVMPFVDGESLRDRITRETQLPLDDAIAITCEVADALGHAHMYGVVHRDIKPENILLQNGHALLADFGIAKAVDEGTSKLTATGTTVGTAAYMSPEQFAGMGVDGRSDQYSLASTLYEMLIGQTPFTGPTVQAIMARAVMEDVPSLQVVRGSIPDELEDVILRALDKTPADRYATMAQFRDALATAATGVATRSRATMRATMRSTRAVTRVVEQQRRRQRLTMAAAGIALAAVAGGIGWRFVLKPTKAIAATNRTSVAVMYFDADSTDPQSRAIADGLTESLIDQLRQVGTLSVVSRNGVLPFLGREVRDDSVATALNVGTLVRGEVTREGTKYRVSMRVLDASGTAIQRGDLVLPRGSALAFRDSAGPRLSELLRQWIGGELALGETRAATSSLEAWTLYQQGARTKQRAADARTAGRRDEAVRLAAEADSVLAVAATLDGTWAAPMVLRARTVYEQGYAEAPSASRPRLERALVLADSAVQRDSTSADAFVVRADARYELFRRYDATGTPRDSALLIVPRADLERAIAIDRNHAGALTTLSSLLYRTYEVAGANLAAQQAYRADAYLAQADQILHRLFLTSHDLGNWTEADKHCREGLRRFPAQTRFHECGLILLGIRRATPNVAAGERVARAWRARDSVLAHTPEAERPLAGRTELIWVASAVGAAGLQDSARRVLDRARASWDLGPELEYELMGWDAAVRVRLGQKQEAIAILTKYFTAHPDHREGFARQTNWWWRDVENDPAFRRIVGLR